MDFTNIFVEKLTFWSIIATLEAFEHPFSKFLFIIFFLWINATFGGLTGEKFFKILSNFDFYGILFRNSLFLPKITQMVSGTHWGPHNDKINFFEWPGYA